MRIEISLFCFFLYFSSEIYAQPRFEEIHVCFYNVENLFDIRDDPDYSDEEFTPRGARRWTYKRLNKKLLDISKAIMNVSGWEPPQIILLCEIENRYVLERLIRNTPLKTYPFRIIHKESPDHRGMDVALLYNENYFYPLKYQCFPLKTPDDSILTTREILYVSGIVNNTDTLHLFANHWPSRYSGLLESQPHRNLAAQTLRNLVETLQHTHKNPGILIAGDFNDQPTDESVSEYLNAREFPTSEKDVSSATLYNLSLSWTGHIPGTIKYRSQWAVFDQIMVSGSLLTKEKKLYTRPEWAKIVNRSFLLEKDERYGGEKTRRTYSGFRYSGGTSDHLPVLLRLKIAR